MLVKKDKIFGAIDYLKLAGPEQDSPASLSKVMHLFINWRPISLCHKMVAPFYLHSHPTPD